MNYKTLLIALPLTALLFACNRDKQISVEQAQNYIKEHSIYKEEKDIPIAKKVIIKWDFGSTNETLARRHFPVCIKQYLKDPVDYKKSGEGEVNDTYKTSLSREYYLNEAAGATIVKEDKVYLNKTGMKISTKYEESTYDVSYVTQWDNECKILSSESIVTCDSYSYVRYFNFSY